jgi:hypothetical protein
MNGRGHSSLPRLQQGVVGAHALTVTTQRLGAVSATAALVVPLAAFFSAWPSSNTTRLRCANRDTLHPVRVGEHSYIQCASPAAAMQQSGARTHQINRQIMNAPIPMTCELTNRNAPQRLSEQT